MSASRDKGTKWETALVRYLRDNGAPHAERRALHGGLDRGDLAGIPGVVVQAKNAARDRLAEWIEEAEIQRVNDGADIGLVWMKRRGKASPADGFVVMTGASLVRLLAAAGYTAPPTEGGRAS